MTTTRAATEEIEIEIEDHTTIRRTTAEEETTTTDIKETTEMKTMTGGNKGNREDNIMGVTTREIIMTTVMNTAEAVAEDLITSKDLSSNANTKESNANTVTDEANEEIKKATEEATTNRIKIKGKIEATEVTEAIEEADNEEITVVVITTGDSTVVEEEEDNSEAEIIEAITNARNITEKNNRNNRMDPDPDSNTSSTRNKKTST